jgi:hypothetical protein
MKDKEIELKWVPLNTKILRKVVQIRQTVGNYSFAILSNGREAILDHRSFKILVSSKSWYDIPLNDWAIWFERGFIAVTVHNSRKKYDYVFYIFKCKDNSLVASRVKDYYAKEFLAGKSDYFKVKSKVNEHYKQAIFYKDGRQVSDWYDNIVEESLVNGKSDYYLAEEDWKYAIFDKNGQQISNWYEIVYLDGLVEGESDYYLAKEGWKYAIFDKNGNQISDWYDSILVDGLILGQSDYYIAKKDGKQAIFHKSGKQVSNWFKHIETDGLVVGHTDYYIARENGKEAIFHKDGKQISDWFSGVLPVGLLEGQSDYYLVREDQKFAMFCKDGKQITDWYDWVSPQGLVMGQSDYYIVQTKNLHYICRLGSTKILGPFEGIFDDGFIKDLSKSKIIVITSTGQYEVLSKQEVEDFFKDKEEENEKTR